MALQKLSQMGDQRSQEMIICEIHDDYLLCGFSGVAAATGDAPKPKEPIHGKFITDGSCGCDREKDPYFKEVNLCVPQGEWDMTKSYNKDNVVSRLGFCWKSVYNGNKLDPTDPKNSARLHWERCVCNLHASEEEREKTEDEKGHAPGEEWEPKIYKDGTVVHYINNTYDNKYFCAKWKESYIEKMWDDCELSSALTNDQKELVKRAHPASEAYQLLHKNFLDLFGEHKLDNNVVPLQFNLNCANLANGGWKHVPCDEELLDEKKLEEAKIYWNEDYKLPNGETILIDREKAVPPLPGLYAAGDIVSDACIDDEGEVIWPCDWSKTYEPKQGNNISAGHMVSLVDNNHLNEYTRDFPYPDGYRWAHIQDLDASTPDYCVSFVRAKLKGKYYGDWVKVGDGDNVLPAGTEAKQGFPYDEGKLSCLIGSYEWSEEQDAFLLKGGEIGFCDICKKFAENSKEVDIDGKIPRIYMPKSKSGSPLRWRIALDHNEPETLGGKAVVVHKIVVGREPFASATPEGFYDVGGGAAEGEDFIMLKVSKSEPCSCPTEMEERDTTDCIEVTYPEDTVTIDGEVIKGVALRDDELQSKHPGGYKKNDVVRVYYYHGADDKLITHCLYSKTDDNTQDPLDTLNQLAGITYQWGRGVCCDEADEKSPRCVKIVCADDAGACSEPDTFDSKKDKTKWTKAPNCDCDEVEKNKERKKPDRKQFPCNDPQFIDIEWAKPEKWPEGNTWWFMDGHFRREETKDGDGNLIDVQYKWDSYNAIPDDPVPYNALHGGTKGMESKLGDHTVPRIRFKKRGERAGAGWQIETPMISYQYNRDGNVVYCSDWVYVQNIWKSNGKFDQGEYGNFANPVGEYKMSYWGNAPKGGADAGDSACCSKVKIVAAECIDKPNPPPTEPPIDPKEPTTEEQCDGLTMMKVAKPLHLRKSRFHNKKIGEIAYDYKDETDTQSRTVTYDNQTDRCTKGVHEESVSPPYEVGKTLWVSKLTEAPTTEIIEDAPEANFIQDENREARRWVDNCGGQGGGGGGAVWV